MIEHAERVYEHARSLPPGERAAFVEDACRADPAACDNLLSLLEQAEAAEAFFRLLGGAVFSPIDSSSEGEGDARTASGSHRPDRAPPFRDSEFTSGRMIGRYQIVSHIGSGGMGTVYRAYDTRLERDVALKFLPPHLSVELDGEDRLLVEARAAGALEHPNVCVIHEIGETDDGRPFIAMAFYEGETLKERIQRGPLPVDEAIAIALQIARGLAAAHARGIIHRDVKPGNVMITADGTVKVLDFGLAKVDNVTVSRPGLTPGTVAYMSPEHVRGDRVDRRTDLWSLGVVLYEMLTGTRPFRGGNDRALLQAILHGSPGPLSSRRPETPERLTHIVERLLRKEPNDRYASATELEAYLVQALSPRGSASRLVRGARRRPALVAGAAIAFALLVGAAFWLAGRGEDPLPVVTPGAVTRVLVADFADFTSDSLLGDAVSHTLRVDLARSPALQVAGNASVVDALRRMRREPDARLNPELAREMAEREGIPAVIEGDVRRVGAGYVVSAAIVEAATGQVVDQWREAARDSTVLIDAIDRLSAGIRTRVGESLASLRREEPLGQFTTSSLEALRRQAQAGRAYKRGDYSRAGALWEEAIRLDPTFAKAYFGLASTLYQSGAHRRRLLETIIKGYHLRERSSAAERHGIEADYYRHIDGDVPRAIQAYRNQVEAAKPTGDWILYASLGELLTLTGDLGGAESVLQEARKVLPTGINQAALTMVLYRRGKTPEATRVLREAMERLPRHPILGAMRAEMASASGDYAAADSLARDASFGVGTGHAHRIQALTAAVQGRIKDALDHFQAMRREQREGGRVVEAAEGAVAMGRLHRVRGQPEAAVAEVERLFVREPLDSLDALDRPYFALARFYAEAGHPRRARQVMASYETEVPKGLRGSDGWSTSRTSAAIRLAEGAARAAIDDLERASRDPPTTTNLPFDDAVIPPSEHPELARAYDRAGRADSAIATYQRYLASRSVHRTRIDAFELPNALFRLAELYEGRGDRNAAARHYLRLAELWKEADPELQPRVRAARRRAAELTAAPVADARRPTRKLSASRGTRVTPH